MYRVIPPNFSIQPNGRSIANPKKVGGPGKNKKLYFSTINPFNVTREEGTFPILKMPMVRVFLG